MENQSGIRERVRKAVHRLCRRADPFGDIFTVEVDQRRPDGQVYFRYNEWIQLGGCVTFTNQSGHRIEVRIYDGLGDGTSGKGEDRPFAVVR